MKIQSIIIPFLLLPVIISCEKDEPADILNTNIPLLSQVLYDSELYYEYVYNHANLISEEKSKYFYTRHSYDRNNQLIWTEVYTDPLLFSSSFSIIDSLRNRKEWVNPNNSELNVRRTFEYNSSGQLIGSTDHNGTTTYSFDRWDRIIKQVFYHNGTISGYMNFEYDKNGNLINRKHFWVLDSGESLLVTTTVYKFDNKLNPFRAFHTLMIPGKYTNFNNIIKEIYTIHSEGTGSADDTTITENTYEYNENGYPVRINGTTEYIYK